MGTDTLVGAQDPRGSLEVCRAREEFVLGAPADLAGVRPLIAKSWYRSRAAGVDAVIDRGVIDEGRIDAQTLNAAEPILGQLDDMVADMGGYVSLTAPNGVLVTPDFLRETGEFPSGYSLLEEHCGSNGEGLALEEGRSVWLAPEEHFRSDMRGNWCFASLVRDPFHSRVRAVVGVTFPANRVANVDPASTLLMLEGVAARIGREVEAASSMKERVLLNEYLTLSRRHGGAAVLALDGKNAMMNSVATSSLEEGDFSIVSSYARGVMSSASSASYDVNLRGPGPVTLSISAVQVARARFGALVVIRERDETTSTGRGVDLAPVPRPNLLTADLASEMDGVSDDFHRVLSLVDRALAQTRSAAFIGERGTGKRRLALMTARRLGTSTVMNCQDAALAGDRLTEAFRQAMAEASDAIVLENADTLLLHQARELARMVKGQDGARLMLTITRPSEASEHLAQACDALQIALTPLRHRREDIPVLANAFAEEFGGQALSRRLLATLTDADWPENVDQLRDVVGNAVERSHGPEVTIDDLPLGFSRAQGHGRLSRLEDAELSELRMALREAKGNRRLAAELLQIGRSTLYRRMDYFRGRGFEL
jgi:transcriptional regulator of acetoin/glycerol metabolism